METSPVKAKKAKSKENEPKELILDGSLIIKFSNKDNPFDLLLQGQHISRIGNLDDVNDAAKAIRKLDISFNMLTSLKGIEQFSNLRTVAAYCCWLTNTADIEGVTRVEYVMLQQNKISKIGEEFSNLKKLRELRLDRNQIKSIDNLQGCSSLKLLDLSWNQLESISGIAGLQSLEILKLNNNFLTSIQQLRSLPSIKEINVSNNQLKSLDGIQMLPGLESLVADGNIISTIRIPQTYSHETKALSKGKKDTGPPLKGKPSSLKSGSSKSNKNTIEPSKAVEQQTSSAPILGMPNLSELSLRHNRIETLDGIDTLGSKLEVIDLSENTIKSVDDLCRGIELMNGLPVLQDIKLMNNPFILHGDEGDAEEDAELASLADRMIRCCPKIQFINDCALVISNEKSNKTSSHVSGIKRQFRTWGDDLSVHMKGLFEPSQSSLETPSQSGKLDQKSTSIELDDATVASSIGFEDKDEDENNNNDDENNDDNEIDDEIRRLNKDRKVPRIYLKDMKSFDEILQKEVDFQDRLAMCKATLSNIFNIPLGEDIQFDKLSAFQQKILRENGEEPRKIVRSMSTEKHKRDVQRTIAHIKHARARKNPIYVYREDPTAMKDSTNLLSSVTKSNEPINTVTFNKQLEMENHGLDVKEAKTSGWVSSNLLPADRLRIPIVNLLVQRQLRAFGSLSGRIHHDNEATPREDMGLISNGGSFLTVPNTSFETPMQPKPAKQSSFSASSEKNDLHQSVQPSSLALEQSTTMESTVADIDRFGRGGIDIPSEFNESVLLQMSKKTKNNSFDLWQGESNLLSTEKTVVPLVVDSQRKDKQDDLTDERRAWSDSKTRPSSSLLTNSASRGGYPPTTGLSARGFAIGFDLRAALDNPSKALGPTSHSARDATTLALELNDENNNDDDDDDDDDQSFKSSPFPKENTATKSMPRSFSAPDAAGFRLDDSTGNLNHQGPSRSGRSINDMDDEEDVDFYDENEAAYGNEDDLDNESIRLTKSATILIPAPLDMMASVSLDEGSQEVEEKVRYRSFKKPEYSNIDFDIIEKKMLSLFSPRQYS